MHVDREGYCATLQPMKSQPRARLVQLLLLVEAKLLLNLHCTTLYSPSPKLEISPNPQTLSPELM